MHRARPHTAERRHRPVILFNRRVFNERVRW